MTSLLLGNPTNAQTSTSMPENYLKNNGYYKIAYSQSRAMPVWVAWHLQAYLDIGVTSRQDDFRPDQALPLGMVAETDQRKLAKKYIDLIVSEIKTREGFKQVLEDNEPGMANL